MKCDRCGKEVLSCMCSWMNTQNICGECQLREKVHPLYKRAKWIENLECMKGNTNYPGLYNDPKRLVREWSTYFARDFTDEELGKGALLVRKDLLNAVKASIAVERRETGDRDVHREVLLAIKEADKDEKMNVVPFLGNSRRVLEEYFNEEPFPTAGPAVCTRCSKTFLKDVEGELCEDCRENRSDNGARERSG